MLFKNILPIITFVTIMVVSSALKCTPSNTNQQQKVVVITGATQGIGLATTQYLAEQGYIVYAGMRKTSSLHQLETLAKQFPTAVLPIELDVTDQATIDAACTHIMNTFNRIDVLINNACQIIVGPVETQTIDEQKMNMDVNYFGPVRMIQAIAPIMRKQNAGNIINISSIAGITPFPNAESYSVSKFALEALSESLVTNLAPWNIHVSLIEMGIVRTQIPANARLGSRINEDTQCFEQYAQTVLTFMRKRLEISGEIPGGIEPLDVAQVIEKIITTENPLVRYQVGQVAHDIAAGRLKDVTGNRHVLERKKQFEEIGFAIKS